MKTAVGSTGIAIMDVPQATSLHQNTPIGVKKPRTCPYCKRVFCRHEHLRRHIRIRTLQPTHDQMKND